MASKCPARKQSILSCAEDSLSRRPLQEKTPHRSACPQSVWLEVSHVESTLARSPATAAQLSRFGLDVDTWIDHASWSFGRETLRLNQHCSILGAKRAYLPRQVSIQREVMGRFKCRKHKLGDCAYSHRDVLCVS